MDRERLNRLLDTPAKVERDDIADLKAMTERFPWFSGAHLLLAVGEHAAGDVLFDEQLRVTAAHLPSRSVLYDQVNDDRSVASTAMPTMVIVRPEVEVERPVIINEEPVVLVEEVEEPKTEAPSSAGTPPASAPINETDPLDAQIRSAALASTYELMLEHAPKTVVPEEAPAPRIVEKVTIIPIAKPSVPRRFTEWLNMAEPQAPAELPGSARLDQLASAPDAQDWLREKLEASIDAKALVDRFVQQAPAPPRAEFFDPQKAAKRSLEDHADLVTETLARIYEQQGNFTKAIAAYQRLGLKHPEKSAYFLSLAKRLGDR